MQPSSADRSAFTSHPVSTPDVTHDVHLGPVRGPGVLLLHEIAGLTDETFALAGRLTDAGFTVAVPHLFGRVGDSSGAGMAAGAVGLIGRCIAREMSLLVRDTPRRGTDWLKAAVAWLDERTQSPRGVGVIGMCATGAFAMAAVLDPRVGAVVGSQPALPLMRRDGWAIPGGDQALADSGSGVMALRFCTDGKSPEKRVRDLPTLMGETVVSRREGPDDPDLPTTGRGIETQDGERLRIVWADGSGHSVLTSERVDLAVAALTGFLHAHLSTAAA